MTYVGKTVEVTGQLANIGTDYFTDLQVALRDQYGNAVYVIPWLPLAYPPLPPGQLAKGRQPYPITWTNGSSSPACSNEPISKASARSTRFESGPQRRSLSHSMPAPGRSNCCSWSQRRPRMLQAFFPESASHA